MYAHIWRFLVKFEESAIISLRECLPDVHGVDDAWVLFLFCGQLFHHSERLHLHTAKDLVKYFISQEFDIISLNFLIVHGMELRLTLVELVQVSHLESDPCMCLVDLDGERVRYPLDC